MLRSPRARGVALHLSAMTPDVSVIIPVRNRPEMVREAITSAMSASATLSIEVIVVDDASTDGTPAVLALFGDTIRVVRLDQQAGQCAARNRGLDVATGEFVKFLDSDDLLVRGHLDLEVVAARGAGSAAIVVSGWIDDGTDGRTVHEAPQFESIVDDVLAGRAVPISSALYRRVTAERWDPAIRTLDDWEYFTRSALATTRILTLREPAFIVRHHGGPRVTTAAAGLLNAQSHHQVLARLESQIEAQGLMTRARRQRLAQYYYKELRILGLRDRPAFESACRHILELDPRFRPRDEERQWWMRLLGYVLGARRTVLLHCFVKRLIRKNL